MFKFEVMGASVLARATVVGKHQMCWDGVSKLGWAAAMPTLHVIHLSGGCRGYAQASNQTNLSSHPLLTFFFDAIEITAILILHLSGAVWGWA